MIRMNRTVSMIKYSAWNHLLAFRIFWAFSNGQIQIIFFYKFLQFDKYCNLNFFSFTFNIIAWIPRKFWVSLNSSILFYSQIKIGSIPIGIRTENESELTEKMFQKSRFITSHLTFLKCEVKNRDFWNIFPWVPIFRSDSFRFLMGRLLAGFVIEKGRISDLPNWFLCREHKTKFQNQMQHNITTSFLPSNHLCLQGYYSYINFWNPDLTEILSKTLKYRLISENQIK
jgi:hypothetical protein